MEGKTTLVRAQKIMEENFIGPAELNLIADKLGIYFPNSLYNGHSQIPFSEELLINQKKENILILGVPIFKDQSPLTIVKMRSHFGCNPEVYEPCFYNQDWYLNEDFANNCSIESKWYLIRKKIIEESRGIEIDSSSSNRIYSSLPQALLLSYTFFSYFLVRNIVLWEHDYIWCKDSDRNGDRIFVGRYSDKNRLNNNGFSIHRRLSITNEYGLISSYV